MMQISKELCNNGLQPRLRKLRHGLMSGNSAKESSMKYRKYLLGASLALVACIAMPLVAQVATNAARKPGVKQLPRLADLKPEVINYIRPGVVVKIASASVAQDGTITARVNITDPKGIALDRLGVASAGTISMSFICAYIPKGQTEYVSYTTTVAKATLNSNPSQTQAANDSGGTIKDNAIGDYTYTFKTKAPAGFDNSVTHTVGVSVNRNLSEFFTSDEWTEVSNDTFNFVPNGSAVKVTRQVVSTSACNQCHDPLIGHGGSRLTVELCILCHTQQTINPDTQLTQDMPVLIHKIHMGKNLPSVVAGTPYRIWHRGAWSDFSNVGFPGGTDELQTCTVCHQNSPQAAQYKTNPTRAACGACHDDVNFATGKNHVNLPQADDAQCTQCHQPQGKSEFDASIVGAHTVGTRSTQLAGVVFNLISVANAKAGQKPSITFTVKDKAGNLIDISKMNSLCLVMAGPTTDYGPYTSEDARKAPVSSGQYTYTFNTALPTTAKGSYAIGIEGYNNVTINPGTTISATVRDSGFNQILYFSVDGSKVAPRRQVVTQGTCTTCHNTLLFHGGMRQNAEYCVMCHSPQTTDVSMRLNNDTPESVNFKSMIHKIHTGDNLTTDFTIMGHGNSVNNYNDLGYVGDRRDCAACHVNNSFNLPLPAGVTAQQTPRDYLKPTTQPIAAACLSCHTDQYTAAHAALNTSPTLGESCQACHGPNSDASVANAHARQ
jgi:OmcA/MtrC family decaheme c-type cytochrome